MRWLFGIGLVGVALCGAPIFVNPNTYKMPKYVKPDKDLVLLGKKLFFDPILSKNENISCATCHNPLLGWADGQKIAIGDEGRLGTRNTPTIINSVFQRSFFWDGRAKTLQEQALGPIQAHVEMNLDLKEAIKRIKQNREYVELFKKAYPKKGITIDTLASAIASFEQTIVSKNSRFDKWIAGDQSRLSEEEAKGFKLFLDKGNCQICHRGYNFSDGDYNNVGIDNGDIGREGVIKDKEFYGLFKTPTLRNVALTSPYFHDGSIKTLKEAVEICAKGGRDKNAKNITGFFIDKNLTDNEIDSIVKFLETLNEPVKSLHHGSKN